MRRIERIRPIRYYFRELIHKWVSPMTFKILILGTACASVTLLSACAGLSSKPDMHDAKFWQRNSASSALYMRGPKAQQMLHQDISVCVREISELERLGEIRRAIPTNYNSGNSAEQKLNRYDTPARDGYLYSEHLDYHDFETCMNVKGWERVEYLPYDDAERARKNYMDRANGGSNGANIGNRENVTTLHPSSQNPAPYENLNQ